MLRAPKRIPLSVPHMGGTEFRYVQEAFDTNWLSTVGPNLSELENAFESLVQSPAVALSSGTSGIHLALRASGIRPGDEVVAQSLTFVASINPILQQHARPILIDSERMTWNIDPNLLSEFLSRRALENRLPKAVMAVHLFGQPAYIDDLLDICAKYEIPLIEDAAESLGSRYAGQHPGTFGHVGVYSFNGNKMITGTTGGMLVTQDLALADRVRHWSAQARDPDPSGMNNYIHTEHGYNYRMSNVIAGIVRGQLEVLPKRVCQRRAIFDRYRQALADIPGIQPQPDLPGATPCPESGVMPEDATFHSRWLSCFVVDESRFGMSASDLIRYLDQANVESRPVWRPMHVQPLFAGVERVGGQVAEDLNRRGICLPSSSSLSDADHQFVVDVIRSAYCSRAAGR